MENFTFKSTMLVETDVTLPRYFTIGEGMYFKILDDKNYLEVNNFSHMQYNKSLMPSISIKPNDTLGFTKTHPAKAITEEDFLSFYFETKYLIEKTADIL